MQRTISRTTAAGIQKTTQPPNSPSTRKITNHTLKPRLSPRTSETDNCPDCQIIRSRAESPTEKVKTNTIWQKTHDVKQRMWSTLSSATHAAKSMPVKPKDHSSPDGRNPERTYAITVTPLSQDTSTTSAESQTVPRWKRASSKKSEDIHNKTATLRKTREKCWLHTLQTYQPLGINLMDWDRTPTHIVLSSFDGSCSQGYF